MLPLTLSTTDGTLSSVVAREPKCKQQRPSSASSGITPAMFGGLAAALLLLLELLQRQLPPAA
jgi:hypothetical protein